MQNHVMEREGKRRSRAHHGSKVVRLVSATAYKQQKSWLYCCHTSEIQSFKDSGLTLTEGTESIKMAQFIQPRLTYFSFTSCLVIFNHHDTLHVISCTRPSRFLACNIEKLGMGLGTRHHWCVQICVSGWVVDHFKAVSQPDLFPLSPLFLLPKKARY